MDNNNNNDSILGSLGTFDTRVGVELGQSIFVYTVLVGLIVLGIVIYAKSK